MGEHRPDLALRPLRAATDSCPAREPGVLAERLYWLAVALLRLGRSELAIKSLASAQKLRPRGLPRRAYELRANPYGMPRRASPELDDFYAFYSIQLCRYLGMRPGRRFADHAEKDAITRIVAQSWNDLRGPGRLEGLDAGGKLRLFTAWKVPFPAMMGGSTQAPRAAACAEPVAVDFRRGKVMGSEDRCRCGSGLPYRLCCGRTTSPCELKPE